MLFERVWKSDRSIAPASFVGPGLPAVGSPEFEGIMHLHGRVGDARLRIPASNLVLTSSDFGEAYLRTGWGSRGWLTDRAPDQQAPRAEATSRGGVPPNSAERLNPNGQGSVETGPRTDESVW